MSVPVSVWRIATEAPSFSATDRTGEGAKLSGGRWNRVGTPLLYCSSSISLACLETCVHLGAKAGLPLNRYLVEVKIPFIVWSRSIKLLAASMIGWDALPQGRTSIEAGNAWLVSRSSAVCLVPSVVVPEEQNVLLNPLHSDYSQITIKKIRKWTYDARLLQS